MPKIRSTFKRGDRGSIKMYVHIYIKYIYIYNTYICLRLTRSCAQTTGSRGGKLGVVERCQKMVGLVHFS